jgi:hypothetical protein
MSAHEAIATRAPAIPAFVRDFGVGSVVGGSLGALGAVVSKFPVLSPSLRCGALGGCICTCYLPITVSTCFNFTASPDVLIPPTWIMCWFCFHV